MSRTWYQVLDISRAASPEQIASAYAAAKARQDDNSNADPGETLALNQAFEVLSNPQRRAAYDTQLAERRARLSSTATEAGETSNSRYKWILGALVILSLITWVVVKKNSARHAQPEVIEIASTQRPAGAMQTSVTPNNADSPNVPLAENRRVLTAEELYAKISPSVARIIVKDRSGNPLGSGSGVVVGAHDVITNCHVAKMGPQLELNIGGSTIGATISTADGKYDLCMLHAVNVTSAPIPIGHLDQVHTAQKVYAIGAPQGLELTISEGIVSSLRDLEDIGNVIQTTAPISPGSSGGGLFDETGRLIGITTFQSRSGQNLNFAVPAEWIEHMTDRSGGGVGGITMGGGNTNPYPGDPAEKVYGTWECFDTIGGTNVELTFKPKPERTLIIRTEGKTGVASYSTDGKTMALYFPKSTVQANIDELSEKKMVLNGGEGYRTVCSR